MTLSSVVLRTFRPHGRRSASPSSSSSLSSDAPSARRGSRMPHQPAAWIYISSAACVLWQQIDRAGDMCDCSDRFGPFVGTDRVRRQCGLMCTNIGHPTLPGFDERSRFLQRQIQKKQQQEQTLHPSSALSRPDRLYRHHQSRRVPPIPS